jgi:hypothetical protein
MSQYQPGVPALPFVESYAGRIEDKERTTRSPLHSDASTGKQHNADPLLATYSIPTTFENTSKMHYDYSSSSDEGFDYSPLPTVASPSGGLPIASKPASVVNNTQEVKDSSVPKQPYLYDTSSERDSPSVVPTPKEKLSTSRLFYVLFVPVTAK